MAAHWAATGTRPGSPTAMMTTSAPAPPVQSRTSATRLSPWEAVVTCAPRARAGERRLGRPHAMTDAWALAASAQWMSPMGPVPRTRTRVPSVMGRRVVARRQQESGSARARRGGAISRAVGVMHARARSGTRMTSARPPSTPVPNRAMEAQTLERPAVHGSQWPQAISGARPTCVPGAGTSTPGVRAEPTRQTRAAISWPRITPGVTPFVFCPVTMRRSVPHSVVASTVRRASRGPRAGSGRRSRVRVPGEVSDAASMESMRPG